MPRIYLQNMVEDLRFEDLPANWTSFDLKAFSQNKQLWEYQQKAVRNAILLLWKYYEDFADYQHGEKLEVNGKRKQKLFQWYRDNGLNENLNISLNNSPHLATLLSPYYPIEGQVLSYEHLINRACFWMATGSGKTLVIVKLIEILHRLIGRGEIPPHDILMLTCRDDLIEQLKTHVDAFNAAHSDLFIHLREQREYAEAKRNPQLFREREVTVFYYRSDNLSDEQKEKIIDFRNYENEGQWYVLLDEAHKGDKEESKRQHIYSLLSRNGFLFNFSATFTDERDLVTTAFNFNLSEFIKAGYGKHIAVLRQETRAFRDEEDYTGEEKQKLVLKALILLAYAQAFSAQVRKINPSMYHKPLLLALVNSVNIEDADLKLFFRQLERIAKGDLNSELFQAAKEELWQELSERPPFMFEDDAVEIEESLFQALSVDDLLNLVYNAEKPGNIEILVRPSNKQELAFKLKTSNRPFALVKIGDISNWLKDELAGYEVNQSFEDESFFLQLNEEGSEINILMGSRSFYEGWDSNRPNVIVYINIGTGTEAKKFILQSIGRGVRIEPLKDKRKRLLPLYNAKELEKELFDQVKGKVKPLETLLILGTNRDALKTVIEHLNRESAQSGEQQLSLFLNKATEGRTLLIPVYKLSDEPMVERRALTKFEISGEELDLLKRYVNYIGDNRVLLARHDSEPRKIQLLLESLNNSQAFYSTNGRNFKNLELLVQRVLGYFSIIPEDFENLKELEDEIRHFKRITVFLKDFSELCQKVDLFKNYQDQDLGEKQLREKFKRGEITLEEYTEEIKRLARTQAEYSLTLEGKGLKIKAIANHYYIPVILSDERERIEYIRHIIQTPSEIAFLSKLENYILESNNKFKELDWWLFSKLDESLDQVYIPYYNPKANRVSPFYPDFIFWLKKGLNYYIVFVDPKGIQQTDYQYKVDGYRSIFEEGERAKEFLYQEMKVHILLRLYTEDANRAPQGYRRFWFDNFPEMLSLE